MRGVVDTSAWSRENLAWAAGLFEGEGCWVWIGAPRTVLWMTDQDTVERFVSVVGMGSVRTRPSPPGHKPQWGWYIDGREAMQALLAVFWPWLGTRRRARALEILRRVSSDHERAGARERTRRYRERLRAAAPAA